MPSFPVATANPRGQAMSLESITKQIREEISKLNQVLHLLEGRAKKTTRAKAPRRKLSTQAGKGLLLLSGHAGRRSEQPKNRTAQPECQEAPSPLRPQKQRPQPQGRKSRGVHEPCVV
jgi:hypothetical protein